MTMSSLYQALQYGVAEISTKEIHVGQGSDQILAVAFIIGCPAAKL